LVSRQFKRLPVASLVTAIDVLVAGNDGRETVRTMADHRVDLLILDVMLPGAARSARSRKCRSSSVIYRECPANKGCLNFWRWKQSDTNRSQPVFPCYQGINWENFAILRLWTARKGI
jgi:hypothetical protein